MPLIAISDGKTHVDSETVIKVLDLMDWQLGVRRQYDPIDADNEIARMARSGLVSPKSAKETLDFLAIKLRERLLNTESRDERILEKRRESRQKPKNSWTRPEI
jgi:hypothetical protein